jgi:hypothetical protein
MGQTAVGNQTDVCQVKVETCAVQVARRALDVEPPFDAIDEANCLLLKSSKEGDLDGIKRAMEDGADINARLPVWIRLADPEDSFERVVATPKVRGLTPLMHASHQGHSEAVRLLLRLKANPHLQDADGTQAIHLAAQSTSADCFRMLLEAGANPLAQDQCGNDALHYVPLMMIAQSSAKSEWLALLKEAGEIPPMAIGDQDCVEKELTDNDGSVHVAEKLAFVAKDDFTEETDDDVGRDHVAEEGCCDHDFVQVECPRPRKYSAEFPLLQSNCQHSHVEHRMLAG